jgi:hypothetical protein
MHSAESGLCGCLHGDRRHLLAKDRFERADGRADARSLRDRVPQLWR